MDTPGDLATKASARLAGPDEKPALSIIVPTRNEQDFLAAAIASALTAQGIEILVVDGRRGDRTVQIARQFGLKVIESEPSRGVQQNRGAGEARGDHLLFLHADSILPWNYDATVRQILSRPNVAAGAFDLGIDARGIAPRVIEWPVRVRSRVFGRPYGDQALLMLGRIYRRCGGFPDLPCMEDYAMLRRLKSFGKIRVADGQVLTSTRKWQSGGWLRTTLSHQWTIVRHHLLRPEG